MEIKQVVVTGQLEVELQSAELDTENLAPNELLIETEYTFISAGTELANYTGKDPNCFVPGSWCYYPWVSGYAHVGIVKATGAEVFRAGVGDRVFTFGAHSSAIRYREQDPVVCVPDSVDPAIGAASRMAAVSFTAPIVSEIDGSPWVIMFGLGMVGNLAAQAYNEMGCRVIGVDPVAERRSVAEQCGITHTVGGDPDEARSKIEQITGGEMGNITVDAVGHSAVCLQAMRATATHGQLVILGTPRVPVEGDLNEVFHNAHGSWITIRGALEWCLPAYPPDRGSAMSMYSKQQMIFDWIATGRLQFEPLISHRMKPQQVKEAYDGLLNQPDVYRGVVLDWTS